ncbi:MAG: fimbria/pilus periplasmic chaperone [Gammaproteobacteria bacterium]|nr:fimbria/pilus periplasmic chaperone [Gammaproteobacteria bacterium]
MKANSISTGKFNSIFKHILEPLIVLALIMPSVVNAAANIMVTPSRVVFDESTRTAQVTLMNPGTETGEFRISFLRQNMNDKGEFVPVEADEKGMFSDPLIRYSPRQLTLPPGQSQVVRLMLRKPKDLETGEYRSHMLFQMLPKASKSSIKNTADADQKTITIEIIPAVGISIPVIVRHGKLESELKLDNARFIPATEVEPKPSISVDMHRSGNQSVYGDFRAIFTPSNGGAPVVIALANGIAVYSPNTLRHFSISLDIPSGVSLKEGYVRILFLESGKNEQTGLIAETRLQL